MRSCIIIGKVPCVFFLVYTKWNNTHTKTQNQRPNQKHWRCDAEHQWRYLSNYLRCFVFRRCIHTLFFCVIFVFYCYSKPLNQYFVKTAFCIWSFLLWTSQDKPAIPMTTSQSPFSSLAIELSDLSCSHLTVYNTSIAIWWLFSIFLLHFADLNGWKFAYI